MSVLRNSGWILSEEDTTSVKLFLLRRTPNHNVLVITQSIFLNKSEQHLCQMLLVGGLFEQRCTKDTRLTSRVHRNPISSRVPLVRLLLLLLLNQHHHQMNLALVPLYCHCFPNCRSTDTEWTKQQSSKERRRYTRKLGESWPSRRYGYFGICQICVRLVVLRSCMCIHNTDMECRLVKRPRRQEIWNTLFGNHRRRTCL